MSVKPYEEVPHTADWALRVRGATLADLFAHAAEGMYALMGGEPEPGAGAQERNVDLTADDAESLLIAWLNELLFFTEADGVVFDDFRIRLSGETRLEARATGRPTANLKKQIKAATYHNLHIAKTASGREATIVFDV